MLFILIGSGFTRSDPRGYIYLLENYAQPPVPFVSRPTLSLLEINANEAAVGGLLPVKGSYVGYAGRRSVRGNSKSALLAALVCGVSALVRGTSVRTTCSGLAKCRIVPRTRTSSRLRAESQLNYAEPLTIYDSAKKSISQLNGRVRRTGASSEFVSFQASCLLGAKLTVDRKFGATSSFDLSATSPRKIRSGFA